jgi:tetratricopeptide (TPR) repeat protein
MPRTWTLFELDRRKQFLFRPVFPCFWALAFTLVFAFASLGGCASFSDSRFFVKAVDDRRKAELLTEKGAALYESDLVKAENFERIKEVRRYFETALRYDPENRTAARYMEYLNTFVQTRVNKKIALAGSLAKKPNRTEEENFQLCAAVAEASRLDPENDEIGKLKEDSEPVCAALAASYAEKGKNIRSSVIGGGGDEKTEQAYLQALDYYRKVLVVDPENKRARSEKKALQDDLSPFFQRKRAEVEQKIAKGQFDQANKDLAALRAFDKKLDGRFEREVKALSYSLYYRWAKRSLEQKKYQTAGDLVDKALAVDKTPEATNLKREILARKRTLEEGVDFEAFLEYVDSLIDQNRLGDANRSIEKVLGKTTDQGRTRQLEQRKARVGALLPDLYKQGVDAYKEESFQKAIQSLGVVVDVDPDYEQAASYLEKARSKQRLLESM